MRERDYTGSMYARLVGSISRRYTVYSIQDYCEAHAQGRLPDRYMIMRHDVDADVDNAVAMAKTDAAHGIRSTFYFRMTPAIFQPQKIRAIESLGHEIGYHYEVLSDAKGDFVSARRLFAENLRRLREIATVKTACMHGRSLSRFNNLDFFRRYRLEAFNLIAEPYLSIDYSDKYYFSDTGLCWDNQRFNIRDHVRSRGNGDVRTSAELIRFIESSIPGKAALLTHTNNWVDSLVWWSIYQSLFFVLNRVKTLRKKIVPQEPPSQANP